MEYYDRTLFEITSELDGYNMRWEETRAPFRDLYALIYNTNAGKGKTKQAWELMPFPSEKEEIEWQNKIKTMRDAAKLKQQVKGGGDGRTGINSKV